MNYIKAIIKNAYTKLSYTHSNTYAWLSNTLRATATMLRWHPAALKSMLMTPQPQNLSERWNQYCHARQGCQRWDQSWDVGTAGCPLPIATLQPNTWLCPVTPSTQAWKHPFSFFSFFFLSARRHPTKQGTLAFKRFLFARRGLPWIGCIHQLALCLELLPLWLQIWQNTEQEPDINLSRSKEIFSSEMRRKQKTSLLLTQSSLSGQLYLTSRRRSTPAHSGCARGTRSGTAPAGAQVAASTGWEMQKPFPSDPLLGEPERAA